MRNQILPHGGELVDRVAKGAEKEKLQEKIKRLKKIVLNEREISDVYMLAIGCFSPLEGFMLKDDYESVLENMRLKNGVVWPIPITLSVESQEMKVLKKCDEVALLDEEGNALGILFVEEVYRYDKEKEAELVYRTKDSNHPGVAYVYSQDDYLVGGKVILLKEPRHKEFKDYWFSPQEFRKVIENKRWGRVVGFQTRNPIHRAHEFIIKCALEIVDGLFLNPLVGRTKKDDIPAKVRMRCYEVLIDKYFPKNRVFMGVYGAAMRYAGPKEAILHALVRKNFGCTHFIVGRDHAGVGNYYGPFDAQKIFDEFAPEEIDITPLFFENAFWCRKCQEMRTTKTCPHSEIEHLSFSGSKVRELLRSGEVPPPEFTRPEVANILLEWWRNKEEG